MPPFNGASRWKYTINPPQDQFGLRDPISDGGFRSGARYPSLPSFAPSFASLRAARIVTAKQYRGFAYLGHSRTPAYSLDALLLRSRGSAWIV